MDFTGWSGADMDMDWVGSIHGLGRVEILANNKGWVGLDRLNHVNFISVIVVAVSVAVWARLFIL